MEYVENQKEKRQECLDHGPRYTTIDKPVHRTINLEAATYRPRYTSKERVRHVEHQPPPTMKQHTLKPYKTKSEDPTDNTPDTPKQPKGGPKQGKTPIPLEPRKKILLQKAMAWEHPTSTFNVGSVTANVNGVLQHQPPDMKDLVVSETERSSVAADASMTSRQFLVAQFIERAIAEGGGVTSESDREILDNLCPRIHSQSNKDEASQIGQTAEKDVDDLMSARTTKLYFLEHKSASGRSVEQFISRKRIRTLQQDEQSRYQQKDDIPSNLVLAICVDANADRIQTTLQPWKLGDSEEEASVIHISDDLSAMENFALLNGANKNARKLGPVSSVEHGFVSLSERELVIIFWANPVLKSVLLAPAKSSISSGCTQLEVLEWIADMEPGYIIISSKRRKSHKRAVRLLSISELRQHVGVVRDPSFDPNTYNGRGYVLRVHEIESTLVYRRHGQDELNQFYNGNNFQYKRHKYDAKKARVAEHAIITDCLLNMVGGSIGRPKPFKR
ncbi:hypothetical protein BGZ65_008101 [Modicella reniformis]|uniref:Uncharacterized protein n=1 Tax=Modicella reniformis TaxID=1440133 RepID=A0A9P6MF39_9FUNG|nr:hypothetical protein BGZ65_008101 [Modicella reniformis]